MRKCKTATYLFQNPRSSHFFFRVRVPGWLRRAVRTRELRYTLETADLIEARYRALKLARAAKDLFTQLKHGDVMELTKETIDRLMKEHLRELLDEAEADRAATAKPWTRERLEEQDFGLWSLAGDARESLALNDYSEISKHVDELLRQKGLEGVEKGSETYGRLCRELLKVHIRFYEIEQRRLWGDYSDHVEEELSKPEPTLRPAAGGLIVRPSVSAPAAAMVEKPSVGLQQIHSTEGGALLSRVIQEYAEEKKRGGAWSPKTELENLTSFNLLKEVLGDIPVGDITTATMREYKQILMKLPPNIRKSPEYRDKSIREILDSGATKLMNTTTLNKQLDRASSLFRWAVRNGYMDRNPAEGLQLKAGKRDDEYRAVFTPEELKKIFQSRDYLEDIHKYGYRFWLPVIALYSGMRLNEICQLRLVDVYRADDGVYVFDVKQRAEETKTKTAAGDRLVPLHDFLVEDLNLPGYIERLRSEGQTRLFPELRKTRDGYGAAATRWFKRYRDRYGIKDTADGKKDFHTFRHTVTNLLKQVGAEEIMAREFLGHSTKGSVTYGRYGKRYSPKVIKEQIVDRLKYDVDLSHLKRSKFVVPS